MKYNPHDYQSYATQFILEHPVAAILLQMGLGKSVITLTAMKELFDRGEISRALVIAPLRVARDTWPEEIRKWDHLQGLTYSVAVGPVEERRAALRRARRGGPQGLGRAVSGALFRPGEGLIPSGQGCGAEHQHPHQRPHPGQPHGFAFHRSSPFRWCLQYSPRPAQMLSSSDAPENSDL
jgi:hypothetical protein